MADYQAVPPWAFLMNQANQVPPDQAQMSPSQGQVPPYLTPNPGANGAVANLGPKPTNNPATDDPAGQVPVVPPKRLNDYIELPNHEHEKAATEPFSRNSVLDLAHQSGGLDAIDQYIKDFQAQPQGINWTPLAAYIDSKNPNSHMVEAAKALAPLSPDEKNKILLDLQMKAQGARNQMSQEQLNSLRLQQQMQHQQSHDDMQDRHNRMMETAALGRTESMNGRVEVMKDNQTAAAVDKLTKDSLLQQHSQRLLGADRILGQLDAVKAGKIVDTEQLLNDVNLEYVNLLKGANSALGHLERTEYTTALGKLASIQQTISGHPESVRSPEIIQQLRTAVEDLKGNYQRAYAARAEDLKRTYKYNPEATRQMSEKATQLTRRFGTPTEGASGAPPLHELNNDELYEIWKKKKQGK
jgi:hypothetical protein